MKIAICERCGTEFTQKGGAATNYCEVCREQVKIIARNAREFQHWQNITGKPIAIGLFAKKTYEQRQRERHPGGKFEDYKRCPNFDRERISCTTCPAEAWKFKGCGKNGKM